MLPAEVMARCDKNKVLRGPESKQATRNLRLWPQYYNMGPGKWALGSYFRTFSRFSHSIGNRKQVIALSSPTRRQRQSGGGERARVQDLPPDWHSCLLVKMEVAFCQQGKGKLCLINCSV